MNEWGPLASEGCPGTPDQEPCQGEKSCRNSGTRSKSRWGAGVGSSVRGPAGAGRQALARSALVGRPATSAVIRSSLRHLGVLGSAARSVRTSPETPESSQHREQPVAAASGPPSCPSADGTDRDRRDTAGHHASWSGRSSTEARRATGGMARTEASAQSCCL